MKTINTEQELNELLNPERDLIIDDDVTITFQLLEGFYGETIEAWRFGGGNFYGGSLDD